jgi:hypothetical protein
MLPCLPFRKEVTYHSPELGGLSEWRQAEQELRRLKTQPQSVWKLAGAGAVGSQSLVGIPVVARLRDHEALRDVSRVWPFEVDLPDLREGYPAVVHAGIWPTIVPVDEEPGAYRDEKQVRAVVRHWRELDHASRLADLFAAAPAYGVVRAEEDWVLGAPAPGTPLVSRPPRRPPSTLDLGKPPANVALASTTRQPCLCGCGNFPRGKHSRFMPGHDQRINSATRSALQRPLTASVRTSRGRTRVHEPGTGSSPKRLHRVLRPPVSPGERVRAPSARGVGWNRGLDRLHVCCRVHRGCAGGTLDDLRGRSQSRRRPCPPRWAGDRRMASPKGSHGAPRLSSA